MVVGARSRVLSPLPLLENQVEPACVANDYFRRRSRQNFLHIIIVGLRAWSPAFACLQSLEHVVSTKIKFKRLDVASRWTWQVVLRRAWTQRLLSVLKFGESILFGEADRRESAVRRLLADIFGRVLRPRRNSGSE